MGCSWVCYYVQNIRRKKEEKKKLILYLLMSGVSLYSNPCFRVDVEVKDWLGLNSCGEGG